MNPITHLIYLEVGKERQIVYSFDQPRFEFKEKLPIWFPIVIEIPTRPMPFAARWINNKEIRDIRIVTVSADNDILDCWNIKQAEVMSWISTLSRVSNATVLRLIAKYNWAGRGR